MEVSLPCPEPEVIPAAAAEDMALDENNSETNIAYAMVALRILLALSPSHLLDSNSSILLVQMTVYDGCPAYDGCI